MILFLNNIYNNDNAINSNAIFSTIVVKLITIFFLTIDKTKLYLKKNINDAINTNELSKRMFNNYD